MRQFDFLAPLFRPPSVCPDKIQIGAISVPLRFIRNDAARRYILRVSDDGSARVTVPRRGSLKEAREFVQRHVGWLEKQLQKRAARPAQPAVWAEGAEILFRGEKARLEIDSARSEVRFADQSIRVAEIQGNLQPVIERRLRNLAGSELVARTWELAALHGLTVRRVTVRSQRSRWGSCSVRKTISLNWRLIQTPDYVRDYIILHELMHLREMNHSPRFWRQVESVCPDYVTAEAWLKAHERLLRG